MIANVQDTQELLTKIVTELEEPYHTIAVEYLLAVNPKNKATLSKRLNLEPYVLHAVPIAPFDMACTRTLTLLREALQIEGIETLADLPIDGL